MFSALAVTTLLLTATIGCGALKLPASLEGFTPVSKSEIKAEETGQTEESRGSYEVLLQPRHGKNSKTMMALNKPTLLQQVIESSGAVKKFKGMDVTIYRPIKGSPVPLQMQCEYDPAEDSVSDAENYEIHPGDKILLEEASSTKVGKMIGNLTDR